jgi:aspartate racemase
MDFEARVHAVSQRLIPPRFNSGYPPMVVCYFREAPVLVNEDGTPLLPMQPNPRLLEEVARLGSWADFLVITANGPHVMRDAIEAAAGIPLLSMIDITLEEIKGRQPEKVGVLGLGEPMVYLRPLEGLGIACETIPLELRDRLDRAIFALMEGRVDDESRQVAREAVQELRDKGADVTILGCTEIPLLLGDEAERDDLINPLALLAEAVVKHAIS